MAGRSPAKGAGADKKAGAQRPPLCPARRDSGRRGAQGASQGDASAPSEKPRPPLQADVWGVDAGSVATTSHTPHSRDPVGVVGWERSGQPPTPKGCKEGEGLERSAQGRRGASDLPAAVEATEPT